MTSEKGFMTLLRAIPRVLKQIANTHVVLAGDGPERPLYERFVASEGLSDHVTFTGLVQDPIGHGLFAASDVVCQVSNWNEAFGLVIAEAMASSRPVIGTAVGGIPELVRDGVTGYLVDRHDSAAVADKLISLAENPNLRGQLGDAAAALCRQHFDIRRNVEQTIGIYDLAY